MPLAALAIMKLPEFAAQAEAVNQSLKTIPNEYVQGQMRVPLAMAQILPIGIKGLLAATMLFVSFTTHDTYLHSWGSIFIQDVVMPLRRRALTPEQHIRLLRASVVGVAVFAFLFSLWYPMSQKILFFFAITGTIWLGGSGAVIIGGLYWRRGTTAGAYCALTVGAVLGVAGLIIPQYWQAHYGRPFPINGQVLWFIAMLSAIAVYVVVSLITGRGRPPYNLEKLLHRGAYRLPGDEREIYEQPKSIWLKITGITPEFSRTDRMLAIALVAYQGTYFLWFLTFSLINLLYPVDDAFWLKYWWFDIRLKLAISVPAIIWFTIGGPSWISGVCSGPSRRFPGTPATTDASGWMRRMSRRPGDGDGPCGRGRRGGAGQGGPGLVQRADVRRPAGDHQSPEPGASGEQAERPPDFDKRAGGGVCGSLCQQDADVSAGRVPEHQDRTFPARHCPPGADQQSHVVRSCCARRPRLEPRRATERRPAQMTAGDTERLQRLTASLHQKERGSDLPLPVRSGVQGPGHRDDRAGHDGGGVGERKHPDPAGPVRAADIQKAAGPEKPGGRHEPIERDSRAVRQKLREGKAVRAGRGLPGGLRKPEADPVAGSGRLRAAGHRLPGGGTESDRGRGTNTCRRRKRHALQNGRIGRARQTLDHCEDSRQEKGSHGPPSSSRFSRPSSLRIVSSWAATRFRRP